MTTYDVAWMRAALNEPGSGSSFVTACPACNSPKSLSVGPGVDEDGIALAHCFDPKCEITDQRALVTFLDGGPSIALRSEVAYEQPSADQGDDYPIEWWAGHCGVPVSFLSTLPIASYDGRVAFLFDGTDAMKLRPGDGDAAFGWSQDDKHRPPLWPIPGEGVPLAMLLVEGEGDATTMAYLLRDEPMISVHSITKGAGTEVPVRAWREYKRRGLFDVAVLFDEDEAGDLGAAKNIETAREAGLTAYRVHLDGIDPLIGEKDARDLWLRRLTLPERDWDGNRVYRPYADASMEFAEGSLADLGVRILAEVDGSPAPELVNGFLDPEGLTILYGQGDAGKGVYTSKHIADLTIAGKRVLIADFEDHETEWRRRIGGFGGDASKVAIMHPTGALWDAADEIAAAAQEWRADYLVIDSISRSIEGPKDPYDPRTPTRYIAAIQRIGVVTLALAHVGKSDDLAYPFGSIGWHQQARTTWSIEKTGDGKATLEHRKQGNRNWQGKYALTYVFDDLNGTIDLDVERLDAAGPSIKLTGTDARIAKCADAAVSAAPSSEDEARAQSITRSQLVRSLSTGSKQERYAGIKRALSDGRLTEAGGFIWSMVVDGDATVTP